MPLSGALYASVSGLDAMSTAISVIGDNIANVNTTGFKARRTEFADVLGQSISTAGGFSQIGAGSKVSDIRSQFTQGTFETTARTTDVAVEGRGFFILEGDQGRFYSRAGIFSVNTDGLLVNPQGQRVQGYGIDPVTRVSNGQLGDIAISSAVSPPRATTAVNVSLNLDSGATPVGPFDPSDPTNTSNYSTVVNTFDSLGNVHPATIYFTNTAPGSWTWNVAVASDETTTAPANPGDAIVVQGGGTLTFDSDGYLTGVTGTNVTFEFDGGATPGQAATFDFGPLNLSGTTQDGATTQFARQSTVNSFDQDGFAPGTLQGMRISSSGTVEGVFSNGETVPLAQIALATFANVEGLQSVGNTNVVETRASGQPLIGQPLTGSLGAVRSSSLEQSNVDLATEFVKLIINQRAFQANTRTISTTNELLGDLVNLGR